MLQTVVCRGTWKKLKDVGTLECDNQLLRQKVDELTAVKRLYDARMMELKRKLSESTANSKNLLKSKQQALRDVGVA